MLDNFATNNISVCGIGCVNDIFSGRGIARKIHTTANQDGLTLLINILVHCCYRFIFANLVALASQYGHRRAPAGYGMQLERVDHYFHAELAKISASALYFITAAHGKAPTFCGHDHTRAYVPQLAYSPNLLNGDLGIAETFRALGATVLANFNLKSCQNIGAAFLSKL